MKYFLSFVLGCVVSTGFWLWFDSTQFDQSFVTTTAAATAPQPTSVTNIVMPQESAAPNSQLNVDPNEDLDDAGMASATDVKSRSTIPVLASYEHEKLLSDDQTKSRSPAELHAQLQSESLDPQWAPQMESLLAEALLQHELIPNFSLDQILCRTTLCEIQAIGFDGHEKWALILHDVGQNEWFRQFSGVSTSSSSGDKDATILTILQAKRQG